MSENLDINKSSISFKMHNIQAMILDFFRKWLYMVTPRNSSWSDSE